MGSKIVGTDLTVKEAKIQQQKLVEECRINPLFWGMYTLQNHFRDKPAHFHLKIVKEAMENSHLAIAAPRESAKSTVITFLMTAHGIAFQLYRHIIILQNTFTKAAGSLEAVKTEYKSNQKLRKQVSVTISRDSVGDTIFEHKNGFKTRVFCKGVEQIGGIRGEKFDAWRPDLIIVDDLEDDELVKNPERRIDLQNQFDEALIPAGQKGVCKYIAIGTVLHDDSQMAKLISKDQYTEWRKLKFVARHKGKDTGKYYSLWPEKWTVEELNAMEAKKPSVFAKEMQNDPVSGRISKFNRVDFRYWTIENMQYVLFGAQGDVLTRGDLTNCVPAIACDLAWEEKRRDDDSVIFPGFLTPTSDILLYEYIAKKGMRPNEMAEMLFGLEEKLKNMTGRMVYIGFEKGKLEKVAQWFLKEEMRKRNHMLNTKSLEWVGDKTERIVSKLEPRYCQHTIYHMHGMGKYEHQLLRVPGGTHDDLVDGAQGLCQLLKYPAKPKKSSPKEEDPMFNWLRNQAIKAKRTSKKKYVFGKGTRLQGVSAIQAWR